MKNSIALASLLLLLASVATSAAPSTDIPALKVITVDGANYELAAHRGKWVIVNYWATWCSPCIAEMPEISGFVQEHDNVVAIGLAFEDTDKAEVRAFLAEHPVVYPVAQVDVFDPPSAFGAPRGLPTTYVIAPDGSVAKKFIGPITAADLARATGVNAE